MDTQDARQSLEQMLRELDASSAILENEGAGTGNELSHADQRAQVEAALARIDAGTYGTCVDCGQQIPDARLEVRPEAARCVADQEKFEAAGG